MQNAVKGLIASGIQVVLPEHLKNCVVENPDNIVAVVPGKGGALSSPVYGYEIQYANQELAEQRVRREKLAFHNLMASYGIHVNKPSVGKESKKAHHKVRQSPKDRQKRAGFMNRKAQLRQIKQDIKAAIACANAAAGTAAAQVYLDEIQMLRNQMQEMQSA